MHGWQWASIAGMITGSLTVIVWKQLDGGIFELYELLPGFIAAWCAIKIFSSIGPKNSDTTLALFDRVQDALQSVRHS